MGAVQPAQQACLYFIHLFQILIDASIFSDYLFLLSLSRLKSAATFQSSVGWSVHQTIGSHFVRSPKELSKEGLSTSLTL